jgi:hypothetical protein
MTPSEKKKLIVMNAGIWVLAILVAFVLPMVAKSVSSGDAKLLQVLCFAFPLFAGMVISGFVINGSITEHVD